MHLSDPADLAAAAGDAGSVDPLSVRIRALLNSLPIWLLPTFLALVLGLLGISNQSIWMDEAATLTIATRSTTDMLRMFAHDEVLQAPYYMFMHVWTWVAGSSEMALRLPSALGVAAAAGLTASLGGRLYSSTTGFVGGLIFASIPAMTSLFAHEARVYGLLLAIVCASAIALLRVVDAPSRVAWATYGVLVLALGLGHVLALAVLPSHALFVRLRLPHRSLMTWVIVSATASVPALALAVISRLQGTVFVWIEIPDLEAALDAAPELVGSITLASLLVGFGVPVLRRIPQDAFIVAWLIAPPAILFVASYVLTPLFVPRYFIIVVPALALFAARGLGHSRLASISGLAVVLVLAISGASAMRGQPSRAQDYRSAGAYLVQHYSSDDGLLVDHPAHRDGLDYYFGDAPHPRDVLFARSAAERGRLYAEEVYPASPEDLAGLSRVWVVEGRRLDRREEFRDLLRDFDLSESVDLYGLEISLYVRSD
jgi:mannosyltransferase